MNTEDGNLHEKNKHKNTTSTTTATNNNTVANILPLKWITDIFEYRMPKYTQRTDIIHLCSQFMNAQSSERKGVRKRERTRGKKKRRKIGISDFYSFIYC